ncbi:MAG: TatD family deoxyribonuclease [Acidobacteria bacterium]|nr:MAG: TatD family deoxyribonuclease [Acidobacteriota bacterium]
MKLVDSHCHLDDEQFAQDRDATIERACAAGIERMMAIGTGGGPPDLEVAIRLAAQYAFIYATVGVHPHDAAKATPETFSRMAELARQPKVLAIGEIGLDYHYDFSPRDVQRSVFAAQLELAARTRKPIVIHTREAWEDTLALIRESGLPNGGIMHCFTGGPKEAEQALEKADNVRQAAALTPEDRILVETDAPYLAPVPHRGKRNEPAFMVETARRLGEVRGVTLEDITSLTTRNFDRLCAAAGGPY